jgi:hypothetical protein
MSAWKKVQKERMLPMRKWIRGGWMAAALLGLVVGCKSTHSGPPEDAGYHQTPPPPLIDTHKGPGPVYNGPGGPEHGIVPSPTAPIAPTAPGGSTIIPQGSGGM